MSRIQGATHRHRPAVPVWQPRGQGLLSRCRLWGWRGFAAWALGDQLRVKLELVFCRWAVVMSMCRERGLVPGAGDVLQGDKGSASAG